MELLTILYIVAITAESMTGALAAGRRNMDLFGVMIIGCCTALGGGSLRDVLLGHYPLTWVVHPGYLATTLCAALLTVYIFAPYMRRLRMVFLALDALGLIAFTIIGTQKAITLGQPPFIAIVAGVLTGVFGGVVRDILCNEIPLVFRRELYASISLLAGWLYIGLSGIGLAHFWVVVITLLAGFVLRMLAIWRRWEMPRFQYNSAD